MDISDTGLVLTSEDKIFQGINFSALKNELTVQKLWRERRWEDILKHFVTAFVFGALGSFVDIDVDDDDDAGVEPLRLRLLQLKIRNFH